MKEQKQEATANAVARSEAKPQGRTIRELRAILAANQERFERLTDAWDQLLVAEQERVIALAEELARTNADA